MSTVHWCVLVAALMPHVADWHWARSILWAIGIVGTITIFVSGA